MDKVYKLESSLFAKVHQACSYLQKNTPSILSVREGFGNQNRASKLRILTMAGGGLFGLPKPLYDIFGRGIVADILLWKNKILSAAILSGVTILWLLFEVVEYNFITLLCHILCFIMIILFIWSKTAGLLQMSPPSIEEIKLSESTCTNLFRNLNWVLMEFYDISCGKNLGLFILILVSLWILSIVGEYFSSLSFLYFGFLCLETLPALYVRYQGEVDHCAGKSIRDMQRLFSDFNSKVLEKIPRASGKEKKYL